MRNNTYYMRDAPLMSCGCHFPPIFVIFDEQTRGIAINLGNTSNCATHHHLAALFYTDEQRSPFLCGNYNIQFNISNHRRCDKKINKHFIGWKCNDTFKCNMKPRPLIVSNKTTFGIFLIDDEEVVRKKR